MADPAGAQSAVPPPRPPIRAAFRAALRLFRLAEAPRGAAAALFVLTLLESLVPLASPWVIGRAFDQVVLGAEPPDARLRRLALYVLFLVGVEAASFAAAVARTWWTQRLLERLRRTLRRRLHDHLLSLPAEFHDRHARGALAARLLEDTETLDGLLLQTLSSFAISPLMWVGVFALMAASHPLLAGLALLPIPAIALLSWRTARAFRRDFPDSREASAALHAHAAEALGGIRVVQLYRAEPAMRARFEARQAAAGALRLALARRSAIFFPLLGLMTVAGTVLTLAVGGPAAFDRELTPGTLVAFFSYMAIFYAPLLDIARAHHVLQTVAACSDRLFEVLDTAPAVADAPDARPLPDAHGTLAFESVTFAYPPAGTAHDTSGGARPALRGVSLAVEAGEAVAVVGPSGSGKSTLLRLLPRLYDPQEGRVLLDGADARRIRLDDLRRHVALVPQDEPLIGETIEDAVRMGRPGGAAADLDRALRLAQAAEFVAALPGGPAARLGENGVNLSSGQRQRLAIARALFAEPAVLVLDEATSAIDPATERALWDGLLPAWRGRTLIVAAHRPVTVARFPRLIVLEDGAVTGDGPPERLRESNPFFRRFVSSTI